MNDLIEKGKSIPNNIDRTDLLRVETLDGNTCVVNRNYIKDRVNLENGTVLLQMEYPNESEGNITIKGTAEEVASLCNKELFENRLQPSFCPCKKWDEVPARQVLSCIDAPKEIRDRAKQKVEQEREQRILEKQQRGDAVES